MLIPLGILAASGAGGAAFELISTTTLSAAQSSFTFDNIPQDYTHLQVRVSIKSSGSRVVLRMDSTPTLTRGQRLQAQRAVTNTLTSLSLATPPLEVGRLTEASDASSFAALVVDVIDYSSTTKNKNFRCFAGLADRTAADSRNQYVIESGLFSNSKSGVTSLTFSATQDFATNSRFALYGIRG
jgi:hypothetical protein